VDAYYLTPGDLRALDRFIDEGRCTTQERATVCQRATAPLANADAIVAGWADTELQTVTISVTGTFWKVVGRFDPSPAAFNDTKGVKVQLEAGTWSIVRVWNKQTGQSIEPA